MNPKAARRHSPGRHRPVSSKGGRPAVDRGSLIRIRAAARVIDMPKGQNADNTAGAAWFMPGNKPVYPQKGTLVRHPGVSPLELGREIVKARDIDKIMWKILRHRYGYSKERLRLLYRMAKQADNDN
jgi:hypothetical protein